MAARNFYMESFTLEPQVVKLFVRIVFGASGAPTLTAVPRNKGIASISQTSAGLYVLTLQDAYQRILNIAGTMIATSGLPAAPVIARKSDTVATTKTITFTTLLMGSGAAAPVATNPADTDVLEMEITLSNSSAP